MTTVDKGTVIKLKFANGTTAEYRPSHGLPLGYVLLQIEQFDRAFAPGTTSASAPPEDAA